MKSASLADINTRYKPPAPQRIFIFGGSVLTWRFFLQRRFSTGSTSNEYIPESFCWRVSSCPIQSAWTLTGVLWSGSPSSWYTGSPSASAGSAPQLTATCSAPFERNETAQHRFSCPPEIKMSSMFSCSAACHAPASQGTSQRYDLQRDCLLAMSVWPE